MLFPTPPLKKTFMATNLLRPLVKGNCEYANVSVRFPAEFDLKWVNKITCSKDDNAEGQSSIFSFENWTKTADFLLKVWKIREKGGKIVGKPPCKVQMPATQLQSDWWKAAWRGTQTCFAARRSTVHLDPLYANNKWGEIMSSFFKKQLTYPTNGVPQTMTDLKKYEGFFPNMTGATYDPISLINEAKNLGREPSGSFSSDSTATSNDDDTFSNTAFAFSRYWVCYYLKMRLHWKDYKKHFIRLALCK